MNINIKKNNCRTYL